MTTEIDRGSTVAFALENEKSRHLKFIRLLLERGRVEGCLWRINELRTIADLLDRPKGKATWYNL